jgi:RimJ/RimL family protein N-acetyltransferase
LPAHLRFAEGYRSEFSLEVMEIYVGSRRADAQGFVPLFMVRKSDQAVVGHIGWSVPDGPAAPVVGYDVVEQLWGQGYATDALRALIAYLFTLPQVESVRADTLKTHVASRRVMEKAGMRLIREGTDEVDGVMQSRVLQVLKR